MVISLSGTLADRIVWQKEFNPGAIEIPGPQCDYPQSGIMNPLVFVEFLDAPVVGYTGRNLAVRGFGDDRSAESDSFKVRNLDIVYSWDVGLESRSWRMNVQATSAKADPGDTICVLTPSAEDFVLSIGDTTAIRGGNQFSLADLMPTYVATDSVMVNAIDLSAQGSVRIAFRNQSIVAINHEFIVLLYEDRNHDYQWTPNIDRRLGSVTVHGIAPNESKVYRIGLRDTLSFPKQALFAFIDANNYVAETDEWNNEASGGGGCEGYAAAAFVETDTARWPDSLTARLPATSDTVLYCYLEDTNGDSLIDSDDTLYALFIYNYQLHCINEADDSLFTAVAVNASDPPYLRVANITKDGIPEIIAGNMLFDNHGQTIWNVTLGQSGIPAVWPSALDFNLDADADSIAWDEVDSCITVWSGRDNSLLYVHPYSRWTGPINPEPAQILADIVPGARRYYDANVSFPRYSMVMGDTVDLTIRVAGTGTAAMSRGMLVAVYADTVVRDSSVVDGQTARLPDGLIKTGERVLSSLAAGRYEDIRFTVTLPAGTKRVWFQVGGVNRYFECSEGDNVLSLGVE